MNRTTLIAAACALLVVTTGVAVAAPGNAPIDVGENSPDEHADRVQNGSADGEVDERAGPNGDLPEQVPDHVSAIHDRISAFLDGDLEGSLGDAISEVTPGDGESSDEGEEVDGETDEDEEAHDEADNTDEDEEAHDEADNTDETDDGDE